MVPPTLALVLAALCFFQNPAPSGANTEPSFDPVFDPRGALDHPDEIVGTLYDANGKPAAGARVIATPRPRTGYSGMFERDAAEIGPAVRATCDANGAFACRVPRGRVHELALSDDHGAIARVDFAQAGERVQARLAPPAKLDVRLVDKKTGQRLAGYDVAATRVESSALRQFAFVRRILARGRTDASGVAALTGLPPGVVALEVLNDATGYASTTLQLRVQAGSARRVDLAVPFTTRALRGVVVDEKGAAVANAEVDLSLAFTNPVKTDALGKFSLEPILGASYVRFFVRAKGFGTERIRLQEPMQLEATSIVTMKRGRRFHGRLVDPSGAAVAGARVAILNNPDVQDGPEANDLAVGTSGADGTFDLADLRADTTHLLVAAREPFALTLRHMPLDESEKNDVDLGVIILSDAAMISGKLFDMSSTAQIGVDVMLNATPSDRDVLRVGKSLNRPLESGLTSARTDSLGRFTFAGIPGGIVSATAQNELGSVRMPDVQLASGSKRENADLHIITQRAGKSPEGALLAGLVEGRVLESDGKPCAGALVTLAADATTGAPPRTTYADESGRFRIVNVAPARYWTVVELWSGLERASTLLARKVIPPGFTTTLGDLTVTRCVPIQGRVIDETGTAGRTWLVRVSSEVHALAQVVTETDAEGRFTFAIEDGAPLTITVVPLALDPSKPHSALNAAPPQPTSVQCVAGKDPIEIRVPAAK